MVFNGRDVIVGGAVQSHDVFVWRIMTLALILHVRLSYGDWECLTNKIDNSLLTILPLEYWVWHWPLVAVARQRYTPPSLLVKLLVMVEVGLKVIMMVFIAIHLYAQFCYLLSMLIICPLCSHVYEPIVGGLEPLNITSHLQNAYKFSLVYTLRL